MTPRPRPWPFQLSTLAFQTDEERVDGIFVAP